MVKLNNEFREYDFKKNLEQKTRLCEAAEKLAEEPDVISAFHQLQKLHQEFPCHRSGSQRPARRNLEPFQGCFYRGQQTSSATF